MGFSAGFLTRKGLSVLFKGGGLSFSSPPEK